MGGEKKREMTEHLEEKEGRTIYRLDFSFLASKMGAYTVIPQTFLDCQVCSGSCKGWSKLDRQWRHCSGSEEEDCTSWPWTADAEGMAVAAWTIQDGRRTMVKCVLGATESRYSGGVLQETNSEEKPVGHFRKETRRWRQVFAVADQWVIHGSQCPPCFLLLRGPEPMTYQWPCPL